MPKAGTNSPCMDAYFQQIHDSFNRFDDPLVYTPGDNEWTDCHVAFKNNGLFTPTERLQAVRSLFFPVPGQTLGVHKRFVLSQAIDPRNRAYVENVLFLRSRVVFAALNVTGSNDDLAPWGTPLPDDAANFPSQASKNGSWPISVAAPISSFDGARAAADPAVSTSAGTTATSTAVSRHSSQMGILDLTAHAPPCIVSCDGDAPRCWMPAAIAST